MRDPEEHIITTVENPAVMSAATTPGPAPSGAASPAKLEQTSSATNGMSEADALEATKVRQIFHSCLGFAL